MKVQALLSHSESEALAGLDVPDVGNIDLKANCESPEESSGMERILRKIQIRSQLVRECLAECLGVYIMIVSVFKVATVYQYFESLVI